MIPFNAPPVVGTELDYMQSAMGSGKLCGDGGFTRRCQLPSKERHLALFLCLSVFNVLKIIIKNWWRDYCSGLDR